MPAGISSTPGFNSLDMVKTGVVTITGNGLVGGVSQVTVPHGLGYTPAYLAYVLLGTLFAATPYIDYSPNASTQRLEIITLINFTADDTNLYFELVNGPALNFSYQVKYYLLRPTLEGVS